VEGFTGTVPEEIQNFIKQLIHRKKFEKDYKLSLPTGVLLTGPPGIGKTVLVKAIVKKYNCPIEIISGSDFAKKFVGEGADQVSAAFNRMRRMVRNPKNKNKKAVFLFVDEAEVLLKGYNDETQIKAGMNATRAKFLNEMNNLKDDRENSKHNRPPIVVFAATNHAINDLDKASIRTGRFDLIVIMKLPDEEAQEQILAHHLKNRPCDENMRLGELIAKRKVKKLTGADLKFIADRAAFEAANNQTDIDGPCITKAIEAAEKERKKRKKGKSNY